MTLDALMIGGLVAFITGVVAHVGSRWWYRHKLRQLLMKMLSEQ